MKFKEQKLQIQVAKTYAKPYVQKLKSIIWSRFDSVCEVEDNSFDSDEEADLTLYFLATDQQLEQFADIVTNYFKHDLKIYY